MKNMKKIKSFTSLFMALLLLCFNLNASAAPTDEQTMEYLTDKNKLEDDANKFLENIDAFVPDESLLLDDAYNSTYEVYHYELMDIAKNYLTKKYTLEEATEKISQLTKERDEILSNIEEEVLQKRLNDELKAEMEVEQIEEENTTQNVDITGMYDENGKEIRNYMDVDFSNMPNKRTVTVEGILEEGTTTVNDFYVKVTLMARNLIYNPEPLILDRSNNYTGQIDVPSDKYFVHFIYSDTEDYVYAEDDEGIIDADTNPVIQFHIVGSLKIESGAEEISAIEGDEYVEVKEEEKSNINMKPIIIAVISIVVAIVLAVGIYFIIKIKRNNKL